MNKWVNYIANYHQSVEEGLRIKGKYKIKFDRKSSIEYEKSKDSVDLVEKLNKLNELYKSKVLTDEEFIKAKEKLINQYN